MVNRKLCCGCGACAQACPKNCITMVADDEGFEQPVIDNEKCVNCGLCEKVCPIRKPAEEGRVRSAYIAVARNEEVREQSSSGGAFSLLAEQILEHQGVVFGAAFADDFSVQHIAVDNLADLQKLRGSKYVQSKIGDAYILAKSALEEDKEVLFVGTGCQIAGLRSYLRKDYQKLYTAELLCHGAPSPAVWRRYLQEQEAAFGQKVISASFRHKATGWKKFSMQLETDGGLCYRKPLTEDTFMRCFLKNLCLRPSCHNCRFKKAAAHPDVLLGDAWGVGQWCPEMDDNKGTSLVFTYTEKGQALWEMAAKNARVEDVESDLLIKGNSPYERPVEAHPNRSRFFKALKAGAKLDELVSLTRITAFSKAKIKAKRALRKIKKMIALTSESR